MSNHWATIILLMVRIITPVTRRFHLSGCLIPLSPKGCSRSGQSEDGQTDFHRFYHSKLRWYRDGGSRTSSDLFMNSQSSFCGEVPAGRHCGKRLSNAMHNNEYFEGTHCFSSLADDSFFGTFQLEIKQSTEVL